MMKMTERILLIVITATLTSAAWIVFGPNLLDRFGNDGSEASPAPTEPSAQGNAARRAGEDTLAQALPASPSAPRGNGDTQPSSALIIPVAGVVAAQLTDSFLDQRGAEGQRVHEGIDIMAEPGTAVIAASGGTIEKIRDEGAGGKSIYVRSPDRRTILYYAHLASFDSALAEGAAVRRGQRLGTVGSSGNADPSTPHLHFEILRTTADAEWWEPTTAVNPYPVLSGRGNGAP